MSKDKTAENRPPASRKTKESDASAVYLTAKQAAHYLNSSTSTLAKRRLNGTGPAFVRIGRAIRYPKADLDAWMDASRRATSVVCASRPPVTE